MTLPEVAMSQRFMFDAIDRIVAMTDGLDQEQLNWVPALEANSLFVLSTRTTHWFLERGFGEADTARLPEKKQALYNYDRRSKVFLKEL